MSSPLEEAEWSLKLEEKLGYIPGFWYLEPKHSRDQLIGILRELEDGDDPWAGERSGSSSDLARSFLSSKTISRDERDAQLGRIVDNGEWLSSPKLGRSDPEPKEGRPFPSSPDLSEGLEENARVIQVETFKA